ncbi:hypothetical protein ACHAXR_012027 [Thalassiosira sp. AJA248-18]
MMIINDSNIDTLSHLNDMRVQEETMRCSNYFIRTAPTNDDIDESSRKAMVTWIQQVQKTLSLSPETVWIAMSFFDRYLSSGKGKSLSVLKSRCKFQLASITSFYIAVKIYEPVVLGIDLLLQICRGRYAESDILCMEMDILSTLGWRVACHTPMDFVRHMLELLSSDKEVSSSGSLLLERACQKHLDYAITDIGFSCMKPSVVAISCLASSLTESDALSLTQKQTIWVQLSELCDFDLSSQEVIVAQQCLLSHSSPPCNKSNTVLKLSSQTSPVVSAYTVDAGSVSSSPVCVIKTARQA